MHIFHYIILSLLIIGVVILIKKRWTIPARGFTQFSLFMISEIAFFCNTNVPCYNCPLSFGICPVGTMQRFTQIKDFTIYITIILIGISGFLFGSIFCGWACPIGFIQDLLNISSVKKIKLSNKFKWIRYPALLVCIFIIFIELNYQFLSKRGLGVFNIYALTAGTLFLLTSLIVKRPFCRFLCSLGLIYGKFNKRSLLKVYLDKKSCKEYLECAKKCIVNLNPIKEVNNDQCAKCFNCRKICTKSL